MYKLLLPTDIILIKGAVGKKHLKIDFVGQLNSNNFIKTILLKF